MRVGDPGSHGLLCLAIIARAASLPPLANHLVNHAGACISVCVRARTSVCTSACLCVRVGFRSGVPWNK